ncbi:hemerythrin domain-containing protein [Mycolicibacter sinensis]|uniref:Hemerythrin n=1 Tax=Mycolicibacter sinensis (strain JDM601) TaxID=875328 RepID=A0A1A2NTK1_MYCSD|nr:hemerythrin domain-containing protein [Mycolicibacter sinensis]OBH18398.1 hemerythrin [Mycolicibacter sinensis]OBI29378.1 hemerythrin [Mycolicibacter sinensis]
MAQTSLHSPVDVVDFLTAQHERIRTLFDETLRAAGNERDESFVRLRRLLAVHETAEEEIVHPRAARELDNGAELVKQRLAEEKQAKSALSELENVDVDSEFFTEKLRELRDDVLEHAGHEERDEFAALRAELGDTELQLLQRAVKLAEAVAPTRPHPGVESALANAFVGPFASMVDRARDAILGYDS